MRRGAVRRGSLAFGFCLLLAGCGSGSERATPNFSPPDYSYLTKLRLNVGTITVEDHSRQDGGNNLGPNAPTPPDQALRQMAHDRLVAAGNSGKGIFTIDQASITGTGGGALEGRLAVHLDIVTADGGHAGYAEAHVSRQFVPGEATGDDGTRAELYTLTQQMMQDMNVEFEYQVRRSLRDWLVDASGAPLSGSVEQQTLAPPGSASATAAAPSVGATPVGATPIGAAPPAAPTSGPVSLAPPAAAPTTAPPPAPPRSPPPGFLQPPPETTPAAPPVASPGGAPQAVPSTGTNGGY